MEDKIISQKFDEWTRGLGAREARISIFNHIRDIPYAIVPELRDPAAGPVGMLCQNRGSCQPKHWLMAAMLKKLDLEIKYATYPFKWFDPDVKWPPHILSMIKKLPVSYHLGCKALISGGWILIDATWDAPLGTVGFRINENWDGISQTVNAVKPIDEILHNTPEERVRYEAEMKGRYTQAEKSLSIEFVKGLNAWLTNIRSIGHKKDT